MKETGSIIEDCNLMINTYGVNIINISLGYDYLGCYSNFDACIDKLVSNTGCTIVKSAGNQGGETDYITIPGCAMNVISVGSVNCSGNVSCFSSWRVTDNFLYKPDVVAPGGRLWDIPNIPNVDDDGNEGHSGTSYAAPMVVGTIALLMEEFPILKTNPALVKSVLHLGAEKLTSQTNYFDEQAGFGLINYQNMRNCLSSSNYSNFNIAPTDSDGDIVLSYQVTIPYSSKIVINANSIVNSSATRPSYTRASPSYTDFLIKIYNTNTATYVATSTIDSSVDYLMFVNNSQSNTSFRIDIVLAENSASSAIEAGAIAYEIVPHSHSYGRYLYYNNREHRKTCSCTSYIAEAHYVRQSEIVDSRYAICLGCRTLLDLYEDYANSILSNIVQVSANGSYILSNGIVILVDEDVQGYIDGTLQFYHPDSIPESQ